jgi:RHS repeat-associated protein
VIEGGVAYYIRADHIGRPVFATNAAGAKVWTATYTPFGGVHVSTGTLPEARFPGQWFQSESGLHQNWMRDYDPTTGRYLEADPLGLVDGASVYGYVKQSPMRFTDPTGEAIPAVVWGAIRLATYAYIAYEIYCAEEWEDYFWLALDNLNPSKRLCPFCKAFGGGRGDPPGPGHNSGLPDKRYSSEKEALVDMAKQDKKRGITEEDMHAYKDLNRELPDPFPESQVRGPEAHGSGLPSSTQPHGHVGPVDHIPIRPKP